MKMKNLEKMPYIENKITKSKDGRFLIHRTIITTIRPIQYIQAILDSEEVVNESVNDTESQNMTLDSDFEKVEA